MAYTPTQWVNGQPPALNAENLNKIENELQLLDQASSVFGEEKSINLWDGNAIREGWFNGGTAYEQSSTYDATEIIPIEPDTTYTYAVAESQYQNTTQGRLRFVCYYTKENTYISRNQETAQFTTPSNAAYVILTAYAVTRPYTRMLLKGNYANNTVWGAIPYGSTKSMEGVKIKYEDISNLSKPGKNLVDLSTFEVGYMLSSFALSALDTYKTSRFIPVKAGHTYTISPKARMWALTDSLKRKLSYTDVETYQPVVITPEEDGYIRFTAYIEDININAVQVEEGTRTAYEEYKEVFAPELHLNSTQLSDVAAISGNILYGKKWVTCGDSFTNGGYGAGDAPVEEYVFQDGIYKGRNKVYPYIIGLRNGMIIENMADGGMSMTTVDSNNFSTNLYKQIPADADYITLYFGINDDNKNAPMGTITDTSINTFYGAWNTVMAYIIENHPLAHIGIIITNGANETIMEAERNIAKRWGIPYLDFNDPQTPLMLRITGRNDVLSQAKQIRQQTFRVSESNTHPNTNAHYYESTFIENWLRSL